MKFNRVIPIHIAVVIPAFLTWLFAGLIAGIPSAHAVSVLHVPRDFSTIQEAVDNANSGDIIQVAKGTYSENVLIITPDIRLHGQKATLDGADLGGVGIGIHVLGTSGIEITGFTVQGFEVGILLEGVYHSQVHRNELRANLSTISTLRDGIQLVDAHFNSVTNNFAHDNGHNGITIKGASTNNTLRGNVSNDNGTQVTAAFAGCGIQLIGDDNDDNFIGENETLRNGWGIQISAASTGNVIVENRSHENDRAGVAVLGLGSGNFIGQNNAKGNGLADVSPSFTFDLFDQGVFDNTWERNQGTSNF